MEDKILQMFFEQERWIYAIEKGVGKDVPKNWLYQLCKPEVRIAMYQAIASGTYEIAPPHTALIPKDTPGEFRTVYVNEPADRVLLSIANDLLFELMPDCVHPRCKSYLKGVGCGRVVQEVSNAIVDSARGQSARGQVPGSCKLADNVLPGTCPLADLADRIGWKSDLSKYFDSVPIEYIDHAFDCVEQRHGHSALIDVLRKYYHSDLYIDGETKQVCSKYQSLKQGCSVASWLADVILYHIDKKLSELTGYYVRYSDDMLFIGYDAAKAMQILEDELAKMNMKLNPKKVEWLDDKHWFKFLGYSIKGASISLSATRIKRFQKEIEARTIEKIKRTKGQKKFSVQSIVNSVNRYLYRGDGAGHSWATQVLSVVNVRKDIDTMNAFVMDCIRACHTGKTKIGGLGYDRQGKDGCVVRGRGRNVSANRRKTGDTIDGYMSLGCMQNAMRTSKAAYDTLVRTLSADSARGQSARGQVPGSHKLADMLLPGTCPLADRPLAELAEQTLPVCAETLEELYAIYKHSIPSEKTMSRTPRFKALPESELSDDDMLYGVGREQAERDLENALQGFTIPEDAGSWFWQSPNEPDLVVLRQWTTAA